MRLTRRALVAGCTLLPAFPAAAAPPGARPVRVVAPSRVAVGAAALPLFVSADWGRPLPAVIRAVLMLHGVLRDADTYYKSALAAQAAAGPAGRGSLLLAPQFLTTVDAAAHPLPPETLRWSRTGWEAGDAAEAPTDASSFDALDAILLHLADRRLLPNLRTVVVAGHSGGAQVVQRYTMAGKAEPTLAAAAIAVRYVVANPSSFAYFDAVRPLPPTAGSCPRYDEWKYGMQQRPPYLADAAPEALEAAYVARDVTYLIGDLDRNAAHPALDRSCMAEAQGATRYDRTTLYYRALQARHPTLRHRLVEVPGVGHDGDAMFTSPAGIAALFAPA